MIPEKYERIHIIPHYSRGALITVSSTIAGPLVRVGYHISPVVAIRKFRIINNVRERKGGSKMNMNLTKRQIVGIVIVVTLIGIGFFFAGGAASEVVW